MPAAFAVSCFAGRIRTLPESGRPSGIYKTLLTAPSRIGPEGFVDDQQADRRVHGGPEKAVHLYPADHYRRLAERFPEVASQLVAGSIGENISVSGLDETTVRIGDIWSLGSARLQICQPRNPCWKIDERYGMEGMAAFIAEHRLTGWYWRVLTEGSYQPGDTLQCEIPAADALTLDQAMVLWAAHRPAPEPLQQLADTPGIAGQWRDKIVRRIAMLTTLA
ncbi:MAG: MOSC domain-containing protein [Azonexus sp.]|nr:MOSC domain-containing protein [Azonexus sp.]